jgi:hypothetical protein
MRDDFSEELTLTPEASYRKERGARHTPALRAGLDACMLGGNPALTGRATHWRGPPGPRELRSQRKSLSLPRAHARGTAMQKEHPRSGGPRQTRARPVRAGLSHEPDENHSPPAWAGVSMGPEEPAKARLEIDACVVCNSNVLGVPAV